MVNDKLRRLAAVAALLLPVLACDMDGPAPGTADIVVDGRGVVVELWLGRDFMPGMSPPDGSPLAVYVGLIASDSLALPQGLLVDHAWVVNDHSMWETYMKKDETSPHPWSAVFRGFGGPKWGPGIPVDVAVRLILPDGDSTCVRIPGCLIARTC